MFQELKETLSNAAVIHCNSVEGCTAIGKSVTNARHLDALLQCFQCKVCFEMSTPPVLISSCCKQVLGCQLCVEQWQETHTTCFLCRAEISDEDEPISLTCFSDLLSTTREIMS